MEGDYKDKYSFIGEWYDDQASIVRSFNVFYYPFDDSLEMFDLKVKKTFVRRVKVNGINLDSFYIGSTLSILGRLIKIVDFACEDTRKKFSKDIQVTFMLIKPLNTKIAGQIFTHLHEGGLRVTKLKKTRLTADDINAIIDDAATDSSLPFILDYLTSDLVYGMEVVGKDVIATSNKVVGDKDPMKAEPGTIRALYGTDPVRNCLQLTSSLQHGYKVLEYFFPPVVSQTRLRLTATLSNCTLCIIKPHALREGLLGAILVAIDEGGFDVTALNMLIVQNINAAEFYEVYKGIVPEYKGMVDELSSGSCVAMEIVSRDRDVNTAVEFRKYVGPSDPDIARLLRPHTLRARFGTSKVRNAVHCSDLPEDGLLEVEYFFKILDL